jgi:hypothetical protein
LNLFRVPLHAREQLLERRKRIVWEGRHNLLEIAFDAVKFVQENGPYQVGLAREEYIEGLFAHPELFREIVHGHAAKAMGKKVVPGGGDNLLTGGIIDQQFWRGRSPSHRRYTKETILVLLVSTV